MAAHSVAGVYFTERDYTTRSNEAPQIGAAMITPTAKGPVFVPTQVTSFNEYEQIFGTRYRSGSDYYEFMGSLQAREYFASGGQSLLVVSIKTGSYAAATTSVPTVSGNGSINCFDIETRSVGSFLNNNGGEVVGGDGLLVQGSLDNIRIEITNSKTDLGTFSLYVRQGNDYNKRKVILEAWNNLSLDPSSDDYIASRIGDMTSTVSADGTLVWTGDYPNNSKYIRISNVTQKLAGSVDSTGVFNQSLIGNLPKEGNYYFSGGSDGNYAHPMRFFHNISVQNSQGFAPTTDAYSKAINILSNKSKYNFDLIFTPGITSQTHSAVVDAVLAMLDLRDKDAFYVLDPVVYGSTIADATTKASAYDSRNTAMYFPWIRVRSSAIGKDVWLPASIHVAGAYAYNDTIGAKWTAPAGKDNGSMTRVKQTERDFKPTELADLLDGNVNPLITRIEDGVIIWGQNTLQKRQTATDRVNVVRLSIEVKRYLDNVLSGFVFKQNTADTRIAVTNLLNPYFSLLKNKRGIYDAFIVCDERNNTPDSIDRNILNVLVRIQPTRAIEFIDVAYELYPTGAIITEY